MYYNSNKNNNDYYNSYKRELAELEAYRKKETAQKIIKLMLFFLLLIVVFFTSFYLYEYINLQSSSLKSEKILSKNKILPESIQLKLHETSIKMAKNIHENATDTGSIITVKNQKTASTMTKKDIALIVQLIMAEMNTKIKKSLEIQLSVANHKMFRKKSLAETNYYNNVID